MIENYLTQFLLAFNLLYYNIIIILINSLIELFNYFYIYYYIYNIRNFSN